ncbi:hypothetical protein BGZ73_001323 [Actinomortierella ambigua]|nr:hypothetical protein BGZ73_001323 [Actinomortierella ambigua]
MALELHLEEFKHSQELARSFDDDLDFCPSLTAKELSEIILASFLARKDRIEHQNNDFFQAQYADMLHSAPAPPSKAIAIIDPSSGAALQLPSNSGGNTSPTATTSAAAAAAAAAAATAAMAARINTPTVSMGMPSRFGVTSAPVTAFGTGVDSYFSFVPMQQPQQPQQHQLFSPTFAGHAYPFTPQPQQHAAFGAPLRTPTARIPIVDPSNGHVVSLPETPSATATSSVWHHQSFVSVR